MRTCSGLATIMWQSMNMPGTPFATQARTGAPVMNGSERKGMGVGDGIQRPMVILGTK